MHLKSKKEFLPWYKLFTMHGAIDGIFIPPIWSLHPGKPRGFLLEKHTNTSCKKENKYFMERLIYTLASDFFPRMTYWDPRYWLQEVGRQLWITSWGMFTQPGLRGQWKLTFLTWDLKVHRKIISLQGSTLWPSIVPKKVDLLVEHPDSFHQAPHETQIILGAQQSTPRWHQRIP